MEVARTDRPSEPEMGSSGSALGGGCFSLALPGFLPLVIPPSWPPGQRRNGAMGSEACLSVLLATPCCAWKKGPRTPRIGGEWWRLKRKGAGRPTPPALCCSC